MDNFLSVHTYPSLFALSFLASKLVPIGWLGMDAGDHIDLFCRKGSARDGVLSNTDTIIEL